MYSFVKDGITQSLFSAYMTCPKKFDMMTKGWAFPSSAPLELGIQGHKCLEKKKINIKFEGLTTSKETQELIRAALNAIIPAYLLLYKDNFGHTPEHVFNIPFAGTRLRGKIDDIVCKKNGDWLLETKFKSRIDESSIEERLSLDWQCNFYAIAFLYEFGHYPEGVIYDVVRYPSLKGNPKELYENTKKDIEARPEFWFKRWEIEFDAQNLALFTGELIQKIEEAMGRKIWYKNQCACASGYSGCPFINYCTTGSTAGLIKKELFSELL